VEMSPSRPGNAVPRISTCDPCDSRKRDVSA